ncbi:SDR family NAD(P)-dependent oxidoreductase [Kineococcus rhizosphaerae]|uniref:NAD(P)-dependent dehydrogenase (Short-subunit alcohol dehydrogenase family) n=1 Tax=Kineococcus rhizosphaerae TaxID=559628 RepID=A0A2T0R2C2_9ACTN|nr:SDR family oxidoreductase [Kineococcus rhizosphaerae]PRY13946.1 NAD(P)-dependent dehydrogenase (short-subunit alcohol dehydrogenase family) [Kineococcus rhizosphaerae]
MQGLDEKVVVFAGAGGIATSAARLLAGGGARLVIGDIDTGSAQRTLQAAVENGGDGVALEMDISDDDDVARLIGTAMDTYGRIDGLFNVAANIAPAEVALDTNAIDIDLQAWQRSIDINLTGYLRTLKHALPHMIAGGGGSVVNTMSGAVYAGMADKVAYSVTKAGVGALTRHVARAYGKDRVRANGVAPGLVLTEQTMRNLPQEYQEVILSSTPSHRHGHADDIGATVAFLMSDLSEWTTGQTFCVDGGTTMRT